MDATSAEIAAHYTGSDAGEPFISGVPARDLSENDVVRLAGDEDPKKYLAALIKTGIYEVPKSKKAAD